MPLKMPAVHQSDRTVAGTHPDNAGKVVETLFFIMLIPPLFDGGTSHFAATVFRLLLLAVITVWVVSIFRGREIPSFRATAFDLPIGLFLVLALLSTVVISPYKSVSIRWLTSLVSYALFFYAVQFFFNEEGRIRRLLSVLLGIGVIESVVGIGQFLFTDTDRVKGTFFNPNFLAGYLVAMVCLTIGNALWEMEKKRKFLQAALAGFMCIAIIMTGSRGGFLALALALFLIAWYRYGKKALYGLAALIVMVVIIPNPLADRVRNLEKADHYAYSRIEVWKSSLAMMKDHPAGTGLGIYRYTSPRYNFPVKETVAYYSKFPESAHNEYLHVGVELGVAGLLVMLYGAFLLMREAGRAVKSSGGSWERGVVVGASAGIAGILVHGTVDMNLHELAIMLLFLVLGSLALAVPRLGKEQHRDRTASFRLSKINFAAAIILVVLVGVFVTKPAVGYYLHEYGDQLSRKGEADGALSSYEWAAFFDSGSMSHYDSMAAGYFNKFKVTNEIALADKALQELDYAAKLNPLNPSIAHHQAVIFGYLAGWVTNEQARQHLANEELNAYQRASTLDPYNPFNHNKIGEIFLKRGEVEKAVETFRHILGFEPDFLPARVNLAAAFAKLGKQDLARDEYLRVLSTKEKFLVREPDNDFEKLYLNVDVSKIREDIELLGQGE